MQSRPYGCLIRHFFGFAGLAGVVIPAIQNEARLLDWRFCSELYHSCVTQFWQSLRENALLFRWHACNAVTSLFTQPSFNNLCQTARAEADNTNRWNIFLFWISVWSATTSSHSTRMGQIKRSVSLLENKRGKKLKDTKFQRWRKIPYCTKTKIQYKYPTVTSTLFSLLDPGDATQTITTFQKERKSMKGLLACKNARTQQQQQQQQRRDKINEGFFVFPIPRRTVDRTVTYC